MGSQFHTKPSALDFVRRRHWMKKMITIQSEEGSLGSAAIFNLNPMEKKEKVSLIFLSFKQLRNNFILHVNGLSPSKNVIVFK